MYKKISKVFYAVHNLYLFCYLLPFLIFIEIRLLNIFNTHKSINLKLIDE